MRWFLNNTAIIHTTALVEIGARKGDMPPLHVHETEDEVFYVLEGELSLFTPAGTQRLAAGVAASGPRGVPHTYRVESETARWLAYAAAGDFASFVAAASRPAEADGLPPETHPTSEQAAGLERLAAAHGIKLLGPPGTLPS
ncbi:MAG: cupin domain-containing protein [Gaiellaceae bacterium]